MFLIYFDAVFSKLRKRNKHMLQNSKCSIAKSNLQSQIWMFCAMYCIAYFCWISGMVLLLHCRKPQAAWQGKIPRFLDMSYEKLQIIQLNVGKTINDPVGNSLYHLLMVMFGDGLLLIFSTVQGFPIAIDGSPESLPTFWRRKRSKRPCNCSNLSSAWAWGTALAKPST